MQFLFVVLVAAIAAVDAAPNLTPSPTCTPLGETPSMSSLSLLFLYLYIHSLHTLLRENQKHAAEFVKASRQSAWLWQGFDYPLSECDFTEATKPGTWTNTTAWVRSCSDN